MEDGCQGKSKASGDRRRLELMQLSEKSDRKWSLLRLALPLVAAVAVTTSIARAETYPARPITLIVPFVAGGAADSTGRILADAMAKHLNGSIAVENIGGAGGAIGTARVKNAAPNGYTIGLGHMGTHAAAVPINPKLPYDPRTDFDYLGLISTSPNVVYVRKDFPGDTLKEFIDYAKSKKSNMTMGHGGIGAASHVACVMLFQLIDVEPTLIAYRGFGQTANDLLAGRIDGGCDLLASVAPQAQAGNLKILAVAADERSPTVPNAPTSKEAGLPAFKTETWTGLYVPKGTPEPIQAQLRDAIAKSLADPAVQKRLADIGASLPKRDQLGGAYMKGLIDREVRQWTEILTKANVKLDQ